MRTMHPHQKPNWPALILTAALLTTVAVLFWAVGGDALLEMRGALDG